MEDSPIIQFIERLRTDKDLMRRVVDAEIVMSANIRGNTDVITKLAAEAGFDIAGWSVRPDGSRPTPVDAEIESDSCTLTCCASFTSTL